MDESALLDLLECPVCLERLDASAKVLPCQHTFCKRCLLGILSSRSELRCPECRTLVDCSVDELPSNILLVRLLDGIKQRPRRPGTGGGGSANGTSGNCNNGSALRSQNSMLRDLQGVSGGQQQRVQARSPPVRGVPQLPCAKALYNYDGKEPGDLKFNKGDIIILRRQVDENWYHGELNNVHGFFPTNFVQIIKPLPQPPPQCKALYDFEVKDKEADKDCLPFLKDDILTVIRRVDENWAEGMLGDKIGIFPISYVEVIQFCCKQLIELDKPTSTGDSGEGTSAAGQSNGTQKHTDTKKNTKKRHSFTSLTMSNKASQAPQNRHSMEISGPVLISSSNPTAAARIGELAGGLSCSAPSQVHIGTTGLIVTPPPSSPVTTAASFTFPADVSYSDNLPPPPPPPPPPLVAAVVASTSASAIPVGQRASTGAPEQTVHPRPSQRPTVYVAMYPYTPRKEDELELRKGEMFLVLERCQDGWFKGTSMHTGKIGVFPGNYMAPVTRTAASTTQPKVSTASMTQAGRCVTIVSPSSSASGSQQKPHASGSGPDFNKGLSTLLPTAVVPAAHIQTTSPQAKVLMHVSGQMTVNQARNAARTAASHNQERPTAAVTPIQSQGSVNYIPAISVMPHLPISPQQATYTAPSGLNRPAVPLTCAASSLTPPNVSATSLEPESPLRPVSMLAVPIATVTAVTTSTGMVSRLEKENNKKEKKGLLKLLSGASTKRKPRSSPPSSPTLESEQVVLEMLQGAVGPEVSSGTVSHGRAVSCPVDSDVAGNAVASDILHRKSGSLDSSVPIAPPPRQPCSSMSSLQQESRPIVCERYRVVVSYPPQSEAELELKEGDIVFVHKKREDGWFKGTLQRNGKTGLFPGSFVESI
uniref:E3 ubiquitin-protein ligase SH3RF1 n=1 Tax=Erpetoichthys calabaricus TaxID=27687 RepID=A0A8C4X963_ERPCA